MLHTPPLLITNKWNESTRFCITGGCDDCREFWTFKRQILNFSFWPWKMKHVFKSDESTTVWVFKITDCVLLWVWLECQTSLWSDEHLLLKTMFLFLLFFLPYDFTDLNGFQYCSHHKEARMDYCVKRKLRCYFLWSTSKVIIWCRIVRKVWIIERDEEKKRFFSVSIEDMHCQTYTW